MAHFGDMYEIQISPQKAKSIMRRGYPPRMGFEVSVERSINENGITWDHELKIMNISGNLFLACSTLQKSLWRATFKADLSLVYNDKAA